MTLFVEEEFGKFLKLLEKNLVNGSEIKIKNLLQIINLKFYYFYLIEKKIIKM